MTRAADLALGKIAALKTALIEFTDGDDAIAVADAGVVTLLTTAVAKSEGGAVTTNIAQGVAKSWINFNGTGTIAIRDSFNNTSITDDGTGSYTITIANNMGNANYCTTSGLARAGLATCTFVNDSSWAATTGSGAVICANNSNAAFDPPAVLASFLGDLA